MKDHRNGQRWPRFRQRECTPLVAMGDWLAACRGGACGGEGTATMGERNGAHLGTCKRLVLSVMKSRRLGGRAEVLVANSTRLGRFSNEQGNVHFWALSPKRRWYQESLWGGVGEEAREAVWDGGRELERLAWWEESCSEEMSCRSSLISACSSATSEEIGAGVGVATGVAGEVTDFTEGIATSIILSAMSARVSNETLSPDQARTMLLLL